MKLWQLMSVTRSELSLVERVAASHPNWAEYAVLARMFPELVKAQDRARLDAAVDREFVVAVLSALGDCYCYRSKDRWLRSWRMEQDDEALSPVEVFTAYGADVLEEVQERGAVLVQ